MKKLKVAITGGIGSGKSVISEYFVNAGYTVINADELAKELMSTDGSLKKKIVGEFGANAYNGNQLNTKFLAEEVFGDPEKVEKINSFVHPDTIRRIDAECKRLFKDHDIVFVESALVFEAKIRKMFDYIILVTADEAKRVERIRRRDNVSENKVRERMKFQMEDEKKIQLSDFVFDNNGPTSDIDNRCKFILQILKSLIG